MRLRKVIGAGFAERRGGNCPSDLAGVAHSSRSLALSRVPALSSALAEALFPGARARPGRDGGSVRGGTREAGGKAQMAVTDWNERHAGQGDPGLATAAARPPPVGAQAESGPFSGRSRNRAGGRVVRILEAQETLTLRVQMGVGTRWACASRVRRVEQRSGDAASCTRSGAGSSPPSTLARSALLSAQKI